MTNEKNIAASVKNKISEEVALEQIGNFLDYYGIEKKDMENEDGPEAVQTMLNTMTRAIQKGYLEMTDVDGEFIITHTFARPVMLKSGDVMSIQYRDRVQKAKIAMDSVSSKKNQTKQNQFMATMGNTTESVILNLKGFDATVYSRLATVFSMV